MSRRGRLVTLGVFVVVFFMALGAAVARRLAGGDGIQEEDVRVLVALTTIQEDGSREADFVAYVRLLPSEGLSEVFLVPSTAKVDVPGVSEDRLREAYSFGGAAFMMKVFSESFGVPVDVAVALDEPQAIEWLGRVGEVTITPTREIDVFRRDRYRTLAPGRPASLDSTALVDVLAASAFDEPPGEDMALQLEVVRRTLAALGPGTLGPGTLGQPIQADVSCGARVARKVAELAERARWWQARVSVARGKSVARGEKAYWLAEDTLWAHLRR